jgi:two-component system sensor histidine kinase RegB
VAPPSLANTSDRVGLSWLITVRWAVIAAAIAVAFVGRSALGIAPSAAIVGLLAGICTVSNVILLWRQRRGPAVDPIVPGLLVCMDVVVLSVLLGRAGGPLNPVSVFLFVPIVLAALVLGRAWTWIVTTLALAGYGLLFLEAPADLDRPELHMAIGRHIAGMWWAFAATASLVAMLVARLASALSRRDRELAQLRDEADRSARLAGLATLAAGAAHELSTPLGTIAVTARELELAIAALDVPSNVKADVTLIRDELRRCRAILDDMSGRSALPSGEMPTAIDLGELVSQVTSRLSSAERRRVRTDVITDGRVVWPVGAVIRALTNLVRNGLQASADGVDVRLEVTSVNREAVRLAVVDRGGGMAPDVAGRVGEPFFTTKAQGKGLGLGVFVARATVEQLGGGLDIHSTPGAGTRVDIVLPRQVVTEAVR